ncbi:Cell division protein FtsZ 1 [Bienertia sinuspersici]
MGEDKSGKGISLISSSPPSKSKSGNTNFGDDTDTDSSLWKQVSLVIEKLEKKRNSSAKCPKIVNKIWLSPLKGGKNYRLLNSSCNSRKGLINFDAVNVGEIVKEGGDSRVKLGESSKCSEKEGKERREVCNKPMK